MTENRSGKAGRDNPAPSTHQANVLPETLQPEDNSRIPIRTTPAYCNALAVSATEDDQARHCGWDGFRGRPPFTNREDAAKLLATIGFKPVDNLALFPDKYYVDVREVTGALGSHHPSLRTSGPLMGMVCRNCIRRCSRWPWPPSLRRSPPRVRHSRHGHKAHATSMRRREPLASPHTRRCNPFRRAIAARSIR